MTREEILAMARLAGLQRTNPGEAVEVVRFAELVAANEREACAELCDAQHDRARTSAGASRADSCAQAIRARGNIP